MYYFWNVTSSTASLILLISSQSEYSSCSWDTIFTISQYITASFSFISFVFSRCFLWVTIIIKRLKVIGGERGYSNLEIQAVHSNILFQLEMYQCNRKMDLHIFYLNVYMLSWYTYLGLELRMLYSI